MLKYLYVIPDQVGNNNNVITNCIFYLTKKSNQPEGCSYLEPKHVVERNKCKKYTVIKSLIELCLMTMYYLYL
jgi:hypothetical protein